MFFPFLASYHSSPFILFLVFYTSSLVNIFPFFGRPARYSLFHHERTPPKTNYVTSLEQAFIGGSFLFVQFQDVFQDDYRLFCLSVPRVFGNKGKKLKEEDRKSVNNCLIMSSPFHGWIISPFEKSLQAQVS